MTWAVNRWPWHCIDPHWWRASRGCERCLYLCLINEKRATFCVNSAAYSTFDTLTFRKSKVLMCLYETVCNRWLRQCCWLVSAQRVKLQSFQFQRSPSNFPAPTNPARYLAALREATHSSAFSLLLIVGWWHWRLSMEMAYALFASRLTQNGIWFLKGLFS